MLYTQCTECVNKFVYVCVYLGDLCGAPHQVVNVVVELQLPLGCHLFDVGATEHHFVWETGDKERAKARLVSLPRIGFFPPLRYRTEVETGKGT